jgi:hypothetical protein
VAFAVFARLIASRDTSGTFNYSSEAMNALKTVKTEFDPSSKIVAFFSGWIMMDHIDADPW